MIPYPELAAALDRWRVKNGKPITAAAPADDAFGAAPTTAVPPPSQWPEAREWPAEATAAASYGWGQPARASTDSDDETIVGGKKPS